MSRSGYRVVALTVLGARAILAQTAPAPQPAAAGASQDPAEMATHDEPALFKARVNLVMVPVVVRDRKGNAVGNLKQEDFQLFDKGKPQYIARFSMETGGRPRSKRAAPAAPPTRTSRATTSPPWTCRTASSPTCSTMST